MSSRLRLVGDVPRLLGRVLGTVQVLLGHGAIVHAGTSGGHEQDGVRGATLVGVSEGIEEEGTGIVDVIVKGEEVLAGNLFEGERGIEESG